MATSVTSDVYVYLAWRDVIIWLLQYETILIANHAVLSRSSDGAAFINQQLFVYFHAV
jgi:hypothetical protein